MMAVTLVLVFAALLAWLTYWRLEQLGRRAWLAALPRFVAWAALGLLLLDLTCAVRPGPAARPLVLLDGSLSMAAAGGRWAEARDSARAWGDVRLFGSGLPGGDSLPGFGRSDLGPALRAAAASDRRVIVVSDGELDDATDLPPEALARVGVHDFPRRRVPDLAIGTVSAPDRVTAGDTILIAAEVRAFDQAPDSARVEVRLDQRVLARKSVRLGGAGTASFTLPVPSRGLSGAVLFTVGLAGQADPEPRDDSRLVLVNVTPTPGVVVIAAPSDWDARFLHRALRDVARLPVRGYLRLDPGRWRSMETLSPVSAEEVQQAARRADVLVLKGSAPEIARAARARGRWLWPSGEGGASVIPGDWYAIAPSASPVAGAFVGLPVDSFPPLFDITPVQPAPGGWVGLVAQLGRRGADRPILVGEVTGGIRQVTMSADGLWRWAFRGGSSEQGYRALVATTLSWLLGAADTAAGKARLVRPVAPNGRPVVFEWSGTGSATPVAITLQGESGERRDTLRFDGSGRAEIWLPVGRYRYQVEDGGTGVVAVDTWSEEWFPRPVVLHDRAAPTVNLAGITSTRRWFWLFGLCLVGLAGEWVARRRLGLR